jgi:hypothetical protein
MLRRLLAKVSLRRRRRGYHSRHGGLWSDRLDAEEQLRRRVASGALPAADAELVRTWMRDGYVILPRAVDGALVDRVVADVEAVWARADASYPIEIGGVLGPLRPEMRAQHYKLVDLYARSAAALELALAPGITRFLQQVFERDVLLFQSLSFERGSGDPVHQDSAYVVVDSPLEFAAAWIALEDIRAGSGELEYYRGSHRLPEEHFRGGWRNWNDTRHSVEERTGYLERLHARSQAMGLQRERFLAKKGDVLIWSADLAHGGSAIADRSLSRRSLVCHYCPRGVSPYYWFRLKHRRTVRTLRPGAHYTSAHYALA